ncbi:hemolysin family protein, partial [Tepidiforma sp.]|uniref:hemolysin family protein n=1 Tax=Tepidiforma sp. TaxID=2682230 RepID=UPI00260D4371
LLFGALLAAVGSLQLLYLESLRLRTRETRALAHFKEELQPRLGFETEQGAFVFSFIKHTLLVLCGAAFVMASGGASWTGRLEAAVSAWLVMVAASYVIPQTLCRRSSGRWMSPLVPLYRLLALLFRPVTASLAFLEKLFELGQPEEEEAPSSGAEEIEALISAGEEEGILEREDSRLIQNVVAFGDKRVREVMTPRREIVAIEVSSSLDDLRRLAREQQFSRIPVYEGSIDRIIGFVHVRDLYELDEEQRRTKTIRDLMRPIEAVPETKPVAALLREMQERGIHIVYVVDEYGRLAGLATMEDLVEEVFGEIRDEHEPQHDVERGEDGSITVSGAFDLDHLHEYFGFRPGDDVEATTVGGLVSEWHGSVPKPGEVIEQQGLRIEVLSSDDYRVDRVRIRASESPEEKQDREAQG